METTSNVLHFSWIDYTLFILMLSLSAVIGVYFGFFGKKQDSPEEYLHGGKKMKIFPIAASLIASDTSGITLLAIPADIYTNGSSFTLCIFAPMIIAIFVSNVFLPVFYKLQVSSTFEYLKMRFSNRICVMTSFIYTLNGIIFMPVIIYMPALAFGQVTGLNLNIVIPIVCVICIFYTTIGGIKAVVWTDTLQMFMMIGSLMVVFVLGIVIEGGFVNIWQKSDRGSRIDFNLDFDPTSRTAAFTIIFGLTVFWCNYGHNPMFVQRFLAVPTLRHAKITIILFTIGTIFFKGFTSFLGLIMYAHYTDCDPLTAGYIQKVDQILPYYVMDVTSTLPGLPGLFIAGIFCAALSTMSSGLNTMSGTIYNDFIQPRMPKDTTDKRASDVMKLIVVILGLVCMGLVFVIQFLGAILQLTFVMGGITTGPMLAMFVLGMLLPSVNEKGILCGSICSIIISGWIVIGTQYYILTGQLTAKTLPTSTEACSYLATNTTRTPHDPLLDETNDVLFPYKLSFYYYGLLGFLTTTLVTVPVSLCTGGRQQHVDKDLLCPLIHSLQSKKYHKEKQEVQNENELIRLNKKSIDTDYLD